MATDLLSICRDHVGYACEMATEHALDLGPDRVITDLDSEPEHVQEAFRVLFARSATALADQDENDETYFRGK